MLPDGPTTQGRSAAPTGGSEGDAAETDGDSTVHLPRDGPRGPERATTR